MESISRRNVLAATAAGGLAGEIKVETRKLFVT
jgi:hypothetical protein